ncbi:MAG: hypothetical protein Q7J45_01050 [bacterium]|nr:hypothetical protein [bacterium]
MVKKIVYFFDKLEDKVRITLSHRPILYAIVGGIGIILFWKGVWEIAEVFPILHGLGSVVLGVFILLMTGLLVSFFIGDSIILSGYNREKKLAEKTEMEVREERNTDECIIEHLEAIEKKLDAQEKDKR